MNNSLTIIETFVVHDRARFVGELLRRFPVGAPIGADRDVAHEWTDEGISLVTGRAAFLADYEALSGRLYNFVASLNLGVKSADVEWRADYLNRYPVIVPAVKMVCSRLHIPESKVPTSNSLACPHCGGNVILTKELQ